MGVVVLQSSATLQPQGVFSNDPLGGREVALTTTRHATMKCWG